MENLGLNQNFWASKKVLLTGHTGFKGGWLSELLLRLGANVTGIALRPATQPSLFELLNLENRMNSHFLDVRDSRKIASLIQKVEPDLIIHAAAQALVRESYRDALSTFETNILGTINIFEALRSVDSFKVFLTITSDKVYRNEETGRAFVETDPLGGRDPYSASKSCQDILTNSYFQSFFGNKAIAVARAGNVIGGGDWSKDRIFGDIARAYEVGDKLIVRNPKSTRPWQFVLDPIVGYLLLCEKLWEDKGLAGAWNFAPGDNSFVDVGMLVEQVNRIWREHPGAKMQAIEDGRYEAKTLALDSSKATKVLGWRAKLNSYEAIQWATEWYMGYYNGMDAHSLCENQIIRFLGGAEK